MTERLFIRLAEDVTQGPESGVPAHALRALAVPQALRRHVAHAMHYREALDEGAEVVERVLPDGALRLLIGLGERPSAVVVGASIRPAVLRLSGAMHGLSLTLRPGAALDLFGLPAIELADQSVALAELWSDGTVELIDGLAGAPTEEACVRCIWRQLDRRAQRQNGAGPERVSALLRQIADTRGSLSVRELARASGLGERRLQQLFRSHLGLSPRAFGRMARMQSLLRALRREHDPDWAQLAADGGFYDQSHLTHEFAELIGLTPTGYRLRAISGSSKT
ncbi:helix-turn-helix domain-containing protein [Variovorax sp. YR752]|uniref:AraC family transcriptional regulator n=1 Tax=Variovorax sp. YR752 TaxID=1884383 RepID=UPI0031381C0C